MDWIGYEFECIVPRKLGHKTCAYQICPFAFWISSHTSLHFDATLPRYCQHDCSLHSGIQLPTPMWTGNNDQLAANDTGSAVFFCLSRILGSSLFVAQATPCPHFASHLKHATHAIIFTVKQQLANYVFLILHLCQSLPICVIFVHTNSVTQLGTKNLNPNTLILQFPP